MILLHELFGSVNALLQRINYIYYWTHMKDAKISEVYFRITLDDSDIKFEQVSAAHMEANKGPGFIRKAILAKPMPAKPVVQFKDHQFELSQSKDHRIVRLFDLYKKETAIFPEQEYSSSLVEPQQFYNSFMAESGLVSYDYLRTLLITEYVNKEGYYQYFVKRNGQYYLEYCDDLVPVARSSRKLIWNIELTHPWQAVLMKAWLKECGSIEKADKAEPFLLLEAFGLPQYRLFNFRKQLSFIKNERVKPAKKSQNHKLFTINKNDVIIIAKSIDHQSVKSVGLQSNFAAFRALRISQPQKEPLFRVFSSLPCFWTGSYSPIVNTELNKVYNTQMYLDLERNFLMTEKQLVTYFNKFYVAPFQMNEPQRYISQDCITVKADKNKPIWLCFEVKQAEGMIAFAIELPKLRDKITNRYPEFRYFLSKNMNQQEIERSHYRSDIRGAEREGNMYIQSNCDKWAYYAIDYVQGYHNSSATFCRVNEGFYALYIDVEYSGNFNVRFDSFVHMTRPEIYEPSKPQVKQIFDSTFFNISQDLGVEASLYSQKFEESISLSNSFQQIGYGSISIKTLSKAKHRIAMRVFPQKLREAGYRLLEHYDQLQQDKTHEKNFVLISAKGRPEIVVMEKIDNRSENTLGKPFPPPGAIQFFQLTPELNYNF